MFKTPRGTQDILPEQWPVWDFVLMRAQETARLFGFERIEPPIFEATSLFKRTVGEFTDVGKEMYQLEERGGEVLSLRPEGTAPVVRAYFQHGMQKRPQPVKLYYIGPMFRYERPQSGRLREHHQFGCEAIGSDDPLLDVNLVETQCTFYERVGLRGLLVHINSIGDRNCRPTYIAALVAYLRTHEEKLCRECRDRIGRNPLRVLDCKNEACQPILNGAPKTIDYLCDACRQHWQRFLEGLDTLGIVAEVDPRLVRGLDYYTRSVWEILPAAVGSAQSTIGGGGRYDALAEAMDAPPVPGVGFSTGIERVILNLEEQGVTIPTAGVVEVFIAHLNSDTELTALRLAHAFHQQNVPTEMAFGERGLKAQLRHANTLGARFAIILGEDEMKSGMTTVRDLESGEQQAVPLDQTIEYVVGKRA
jgi:histidyl-tRNA synthetase